MASLNIVLHAHEKKDGTRSILFRLIIDRKIKYLASGYSVKENQFKEGMSDWVKRHPDAKLINRNLEIKRMKLAKNLLDAEAGMLPLSHKSIFSGKRNEGITMGGLLKEKADYYEQSRSKRAFRRSLALREELLECWGQDLPISHISLDRVNQYVLYLKKKNNRNTIKKKLQRLAGLIDRKKDAGLYSGINAFKLVRVSGQDIIKDYLTWDEIREIEELKLSGLTEKARDMFLFSFYSNGMRFADVVLLKKSKFKEFKYKMSKSDKHINIKIIPKLANIIEKYLTKDKSNPFLFSLIEKEPKDKWEFEDEKNSLNTLINTYLKRIAILAGIEKNITFHIARHSFAQLLKEYQSEKGISDIYVIQEALGHKDIRTTQMYLKKLQSGKANEKAAEMFNL